MSVPATSGEPLAGETGTRESTLPRTVGRVLPLTLLWLVAGTGLAAITTRVRDWYAMPNELLNEHRAISVAQTLSPLPVLHRQFVASLRPALPAADRADRFAAATSSCDLRNAHALNAYLMTSACIPAYLLARRVTGSRLVRLPGRRALGLHAVDLLRDAPDGRGGRLPGVPVGACSRSSAPWWSRRAGATPWRSARSRSRSWHGRSSACSQSSSRSPSSRTRSAAAGRPARRALKGALAKHRLAGVVYAVGDRRRRRAARVRPARRRTRRLRLDGHGQPRSARDPEVARLASRLLLARRGHPAAGRRARVAAGARSSGRRAGRSSTRSPASARRSRSPCSFRSPSSTSASSTASCSTAT